MCHCHADSGHILCICIQYGLFQASEQTHSTMCMLAWWLVTMREQVLHAGTAGMEDPGGTTASLLVFGGLHTANEAHCTACYTVH